jgi:O-6-methylguanine DNA methyltransferase
MDRHTIASCTVGQLGTLWIARSAQGLVRIEFGRSRRRIAEMLGSALPIEDDPSPFQEIVRKLASYAGGKTVTFDEPLDLRGTPFQKAVWKAMTTIPRGETRSYAWLAATVGKPRAFRAVANACGANPLPVVIPCHRVIASDGTIGGFSSGLAMKRKLLAVEGIVL